MISCKDASQMFYVVRELTTREIKRKYSRSYLGIIWSVLNPLIFMLVLSAIFSNIFKSSIANYPVYHLTGLLFYNLFNHSTTNSITVLIDNKNMITRTKTPKIVFPMSRVYTAFVDFMFSVFAFFFVIAVFGIPINLIWLLLPIDVLMALIFSLSISVILSVMYVFFADISYLYSIFMMIVMYLSAIFYPVSKMADWVRVVVELNPVYIFIVFAREIVLDSAIPEVWIWRRMIIYVVLGLFISYIVTKRNENKIVMMM